MMIPQSLLRCSFAVGSASSSEVFLGVDFAVVAVGGESGLGAKCWKARYANEGRVEVRSRGIDVVASSILGDSLLRTWMRRALWRAQEARGLLTARLGRNWLVHTARRAEFTKPSIYWDHDPSTAGIPAIIESVKGRNGQRVGCEGGRGLFIFRTLLCHMTCLII